ncbi:MAG: hypothetical protein Q4G62_02635 [Pseudomonadota bacterium]|nr:hypothetical protein [Pseudomonadota bacterium]
MRIATRQINIGLIASSLLAACASQPVTPRADAAGEMHFFGVVEARRDDCYTDGVCNARVAGIDVITMSGQRIPTPVWGHPNQQPEIGSRVEVYCLATGPRSCTLKGKTAYYLRPAH